MDNLGIEIGATAAGVTVMKLTGPLTLKNLFEFQESARSTGQAPMVIDLGGVPYMDSAGLGAVLGIMASCERTGRGFAIAGICERVRTLFQITHVDMLIPAFETVAIASAQFVKAANA